MRSLFALSLPHLRHGRHKGTASSAYAAPYTAHPSHTSHSVLLLPRKVAPPPSCPSYAPRVPLYLSSPPTHSCAPRSKKKRKRLAMPRLRKPSTTSRTGARRSSNRLRRCAPGSSLPLALGEAAADHITRLRMQEPTPLVQPKKAVPKELQNKGGELADALSELEMAMAR